MRTPIRPGGLFATILVLPALAVMLGFRLARAEANSATDVPWPEFRGPRGDGSSAARNLPIHWNATSNVVWRTGIPGTGWSSPILARNRLFLTTAVPVDGSADLSLRGLCIAADTGAIVWDVEVFREKGAEAPRIHTKNSHASPTPVYRDGRIYLHFGHLGTACLSPEGTPLWKNQSLPYPPVHGNGGSPLLVRDLLIYSADGGSGPYVAALDARTGALRWKTARSTTPAKPFSFSTPQLIVVDGESQVISPGSGGVMAYSPDDGRELWKVRYGEGYSVVPRPVYAHGLLFLSSGYDRPVFHAIRASRDRGDLTESHVAWTTARSAPNTPSALVAGDEVYFVSDAGIATCADARTGKVWWSERLGGDFSASPIHADGRIYFQNEAGIGFVIEPGTTYRPKARNDLGERSLASYAVADGALFIRTAGYLWRIGAGSP